MKRIKLNIPIIYELYLVMIRYYAELYGHEYLEDAEDNEVIDYCISKMYEVYNDGYRLWARIAVSSAYFSKEQLEQIKDKVKTIEEYSMKPNDDAKEYEQLIQHNRKQIHRIINPKEVPEDLREITEEDIYDEFYDYLEEEGIESLDYNKIVELEFTHTRYEQLMWLYTKMVVPETRIKSLGSVIEYCLFRVKIMLKKMQLGGELRIPIQNIELEEAEWWEEIEKQFIEKKSKEELASEAYNEEISNLVMKSLKFDLDIIQDQIWLKATQKLGQKKYFAIIRM